MATDSSKLRKRLLGVVYLFLAGFIVLNIFTYQHAAAMLYFSDEPTPALRPEHLSWGQKITVLFSGVKIARPASTTSPLALDDHCQAVMITTKQASKLGAWYCYTDNKQPLVILFHGYLMDKSSVMEQAKVFIDAQFAVLLVDFRGSGESSESYTTIGYLEAEDVATAVNYARQQYQHPQLVLYGQSMGAAAVLRAIDAFHVQADAIIIEAVFDNLLNTVKNRFHLLGVPTFPSAHLLVFWGGLQTGFNGFTHNPIDFAKQVNSPVLFFHGEEDTRVTLSEAHKVYQAVPSTKYFSAFPDTVHESHLSRWPDKWSDEVLHFLNKHL